MAPLAMLRVRREESGGRVLLTYYLPSSSRPGAESAIAGEQLGMSRAADERQLGNAALVLAALDSHGQLPVPAGGLATFGRLGARLARDYLPPRVLDFLFQDRAPLAIVTDDLAFPWEVLRHPGADLGDPAGCLGMFRPVARIPQDLPMPGGARGPGAALAATIIGDTRGDRPYCDLAARWLADALAAQGIDGASHVTRMDRAALLAALRPMVDLLYYTGHIAEADRNAIDGLAYEGGTLSVRDLLGDWGGAGLVYLGGCRSARRARPASLGPGRGGRGLPGAAFSRGARAVVGTLWEVHSQGATAFDRACWAQILRGVPFGEALRWTRQAFAATRGIDPTWAAYVLYGDPRLTLDALRQPDLVERADTPAPDARVTIPPLQLAADYPQLWLSPRVALFLYTLDPDEEISLDPVVQAALENALRHCEAQGQARLRQAHLLAGLAAQPASQLALGLRALGLDPALLEQITLRVLGTAASDRLAPGATPAVESALRRAWAGAARGGADAVVTESDLLAALLGAPSRGSLHIMLTMLGVDAATVLAATRGERVAPVRLALRPPDAFDQAQASSDSTSREALRDLRPWLATAEGSDSALRHATAFVGRAAETLAALRLLARGHVVVLGPSGVGKDALALEIARRIARQDDALHVASFADHAIYRLHRPDAARAATRLRHDLDALPTPAILLLTDLPELLADPDATAREGTVFLLRALATHPRIRLLATARDTDFNQVRRDHPDVASAFLPLTLAPPDPATARDQVAAHCAAISAFYRAALDDGLAAASVAAAMADRARVLPGAALERLHWACIRARFRGNQDSELAPTATLSSALPIVHVTISDLRDPR